MMTFEEKLSERRQVNLLRHAKARKAHASHARAARITKIQRFFMQIDNLINHINQYDYPVCVFVRDGVLQYDDDFPVGSDWRIVGVYRKLGFSESHFREDCRLALEGR